MSNNIDDKKVVNDAMENGSGNCGTGLSDEKVSVLNVLPVQKFVSFSQRTEPCSTKCEEVLTVDENVEPEHDIHAKLEIKDDRGNCMFSSGMVEKQSDYYTTKVDDSEKDNESKIMRHEEETMKSSSVSNMKEDGCEMCDQNFEDSLEKHECNFEGEVSCKTIDQKNNFMSVLCALNTDLEEGVEFRDRDLLIPARVGPTLTALLGCPGTLYRLEFDNRVLRLKVSILRTFLCIS